MKIGYARVSTQDQNLSAQINELEKAGCKKIFQEKKSGKTTKRLELNNLIKSLQTNDIVVVFKLDRLGRSLKDLLSIMAIFEEKKVQFVSIQDNISTENAIGRFTFHLFGAIAEFERSMISDRTKVGLQYAREQGRFGGRPSGLSKKRLVVAKAIQTMFDVDNKTIAQISRELNLSRSTCYRYYYLMKNPKN